MIRDTLLTKRTILGTCAPRRKTVSSKSGWKYGRPSTMLYHIIITSAFMEVGTVPNPALRIRIRTSKRKPARPKSRYSYKIVAKPLKSGKIIEDTTNKVKKQVN